MVNIGLLGLGVKENRAVAAPPFSVIGASMAGWLGASKLCRYD